jgi:integrase
MSGKWKTNYPGVRFREHPTRKYNGKPDRYFFIRYRVHNKLREEGLGWASEKWNAKKASIELAKLKESHVTGSGPQSLAEKRHIKQQQEEEARTQKEKAAKENVTFGQIFTGSYISEARHNKGWRSLSREESLYNKWLSPLVGGIPLKDITPFHLERIKKKMFDQNLNPRSVQYALAVIRQVFNFAKRNDLYRGELPISKVKIPQFDNKRLRFLAHEEANRLLRALKAKSPDTYEIALLSLYCGLRAGEVFSLTWGDVDFERGMLTLRDTKSGKNRAAFMTENVKKMLSEKVRGSHDDLVFPGRPVNGGLRARKILSLTWGDIDLEKGMITLRDTKGGKSKIAPITEKFRKLLSSKTPGNHDDLVFPECPATERIDISNSFSRIVKELGFNKGVKDSRQKVVFHTLRHTYASWLAEEGIDLYTIKTLMGHSTIALTERYSHLGNETLQKAVKVLENRAGLAALLNITKKK